MRACVQCGLSISETATFCQVCGARYDVDAAETTLEATQVVEGPPADAEPAGGADRWAEAQPYEPGAELVADLAVSETDAVGGPGLDVDASAGLDLAEAGAELEAAEPAELEPELGQAAPETAELEAEPGPAEPEHAEPTAAEPAPAEPEPTAAELAAAEQDPAPELSARERKLAAVAVLLEAASVCEDADMSRAAALYQEAILGCLDAADDADGFNGVERELLRGFDGLSALLERKGLAEEALGVVDDAAALSLLNGGECVAGSHCDALRTRREDLRRLLYVDSANL